MSMSSKCFSSVLTGTAATGGTPRTGETPETGGTSGTGETPMTRDMTGGSTGWCSHIIKSYDQETKELTLSCSEVMLS